MKRSSRRLRENGNGLDLGRWLEMLDVHKNLIHGNSKIHVKFQFL
jgi:hypothetical protein